MIGNVMRFKLKKTLVGAAALSMLWPMASHADVSPGRWIFDGFGRSTRDGQGSTCVSSGGDTHAFDAPACAEAQTESRQARQALAAEKAAAAEAAAATRAEARARAQAALRGGQVTGSVSRPDGTRIVDGFGRDCVRDGSGMLLINNCEPDPSVAAARAAVPVAAVAAAAPAAPVAPGSELAPGSHGAYVTRSYADAAGQEVRDGFGRNCVKDGRWNPGLATEECHPGLYSAWRDSQPAELELARRVDLPPPEVKWPPEEPAPVPAPEPAAVSAAAAPEASVIDNTLPVFPITTYALPPDADDGDTLLADDEMEALADDGDDGAALALLADTDDEDAAVDAFDEDEDDTAAAFDDGDDGDDDDDTAAFAGDDVMRDDENMAFAALGDDDEYDDDADHDDDEDDFADASDAGMMEADDSLAVAALADAADDSDEDDAVFAEDDDDPVFAQEDAEEAPVSGVADSDLAPRIPSQPPEVVRTAPVPAPAVAALADEPAEFPVTKYEYDASAAPADASALAAPEDQEPLADGPAEPEPTADVAPPQDTPAVPATEPQPSEPRPVAAVTSPEVDCPPVTIQLEGARFDFDKWVLRPQAKEKLDDVAAKLKSHQCEEIEITGHTDRIGTAKYNQRLSERRAKAARDYLINHHGIEPERIVASGKGEFEPVTKVADCRGKRKKALIACYGPDRRVEVKVRK